MSATPEKIKAAVEAELGFVTDIRILNKVREFLVEPIMLTRAWDYGKPGESFPCWSVLDHEKSNTGIVYCEFGFGPENPWGLVALKGTPDIMSMGMDSGWFPKFLQACFDSKVFTELPIWRVFKEYGDEYPGIALTGEEGWDSAWKQVCKLRVENPGVRYDCSQSLYP